MKVSLVHDYLREYGGAEKVLEVLNEVWKDAPIYTATYEQDLMEKSGLEVPPPLVHTAFTQFLPFRYQLRKHYFFLYPLAFRSLNLDSDVILSSCSYAAKFINKKRSLHICYLHSVPKFLWGYETETPSLETIFIDNYLKPIYKGILPQMKRILRKMDFEAAQKVDFFVANSLITQERIKKHYGLSSKVIYPPVDINEFGGEVVDKGYFLVISRLSKFKKIEIAAEAFNKFNKPLKIVGDGQESANLKRLSNSNIEFLGRVSRERISELLLECTALVFPTDEDFGIVPVEAMAAGKPVIAFRGGGALETVVEGKTGKFFDYQTSQSLLKVLKEFDPSRYNARDCREQAKRFSKERFKKEIKVFLEGAWKNRT
ncbi:MAG: glycosyltransferase [Candidatus Woykebacteria bacterium]